MKHVLIPTKLDPVAKTLLEASGFSVVQDSDEGLDALVAAHPETQALIVRSEKVTAGVLDALPKLKLVVRAGSGYNTIDTKHARRRGIDVMNTPGANANAVAEEAVALVLAQFRHIVQGDVTTRQGLWEKKKLMGRELAGKCVGIVGLGNIGRLVARRVSGFDCDMIGYDPVISAEKAEQAGVRLVGLEDLFRQADVISLHIPENKETVGLINRSLLELTKDGAVLVNCARAGIVVEEDLRAIKAEKNLAYCNDVYPADAPGEKSVADVADVMLPHLGASTVEANSTAARRAAEQMIGYFERGVTRFVVNKNVPDGLDESFQELAFQIASVARHYLGSATSVSRVECSFYGDLGQFSDWLLPPLVAGLSSEFDAQASAEEVREFLEERGIAVVIRETDEDKRYGSSMTADVFEGGDRMRRVSVRGTIAEGNLVISRINEFDKLYFQPRGESLVAIYEDRPGVLARVTAACGDADINIEDIRSPHDESGRRSIAVLKLNRAIPASVVEKLRKDIQTDNVFSISIP